ncbi:hypothetical protein [Thalassoroseus pseudoceratinae]|uniref:hypothetical protein n=1 Tax=Thalassoroseus pseudoceratinae TaxID=2713176 RepID=UPI00141F793A|nr:hypothetical protein [Thalassoroseus pseudoceratinae]
MSLAKAVSAAVLVVTLMVTSDCKAAMLTPSFDDLPADLLFEGPPGVGVEDGPAWGRFLRPAHHGYEMLYLSQYRPYEPGYRLDLTMPVPLGWTFSVGPWHGLMFHQRISRNIVQFLKTHGAPTQNEVHYPLRFVDFLDHLPADPNFANILTGEQIESFNLLQKLFVSMSMFGEFLAGTAEGKAIFVFDETEGFGNPGGDPFYLADGECYVENEWSSETTHARVTLADGTAAGMFLCERDRSVYSLLGIATIELTFKFIGGDNEPLTEFVSVQDEDSYLAGIRTSTDSSLPNGLAALSSTGNGTTGGSGSSASSAGVAAFGSPGFGTGSAGGGGGSGGGAPGGSLGLITPPSDFLLLTSTSDSFDDVLPDGPGGMGPGLPGDTPDGGGPGGGGPGGGDVPDGGGSVITVSEPGGAMLLFVAACLLVAYDQFRSHFLAKNNPSIAA